MADYTVTIKDVAGGGEYEVPFLSASYTDELNVGTNATFKFEYNDLDRVANLFQQNIDWLISGGLREIWISKGSTKVFYGIISEYDTDSSTNGQINVTVGAIGFMALLGKRRTGSYRYFNGVDSATIAWTLIDESQTQAYGDIGLTQGVHPTTVSRERTFRFANLKDEIQKMSRNNLANGFDFDIDTTKHFNVYYPLKGAQRPEIVLDDKNIVKISTKTPLVSTMTNRVYVQGQDDNTYAQRDSIDAYKNSFGLLEDVLAKRDVIELSTLNDAGDGVLSDQQGPVMSISVSHMDGDPDILTYAVGDWLRVMFNARGLSDTFWRVKKQSVAIDPTGPVTVSLDMRSQ